MNIRTPHLSAAAAAALLLGCAATLEPRIDTEGFDRDQLRADLAECEAIAREAEVDGDLEIPGEDRPVAGADRPGDPQPEGTGAPAETRVLTEAEQRQRIVESCMVERGYRLLN